VLQAQQECTRASKFMLIYGLVEEVISAAQDPVNTVASLFRLVSNITGIKRVPAWTSSLEQISNPLGGHHHVQQR